MTTRNDKGLPKIPPIPKLRDVPEEQRTPLVLELFTIIPVLLETNRILQDEIARLKGLNPRPKLKPSELESCSRKREKADGEGDGAAREKGKRAGSAKRSKTKTLTIHETVDIKPENIPAGSQFKGYDEYTVQELAFHAHNTRYRLERWRTPSGETIKGRLPPEVAGRHYGPLLVTFVLHQYYHAHVTQPLILEQLRELEFDISAGKVNAIITEDGERFQAEKDEILRVGLKVSTYIQADDTGARHKGRNGYCTHIGNELFAWFETTYRKSRINFLELLRGKREDYVLTVEALDYMRAQKLPKGLLVKLAGGGRTVLKDRAEWEAHLRTLGIVDERHVRIATEGALLGSALAQGVAPTLVVMSDAAGQFDILLHCLCWFHAERLFQQLIALGEKDRVALEEVRNRIWNFYDELKAYKQKPDAQKKAKLSERFDEIFTAKTCFAGLNNALRRIHRKKAKLLLVLDHPEIPLHNNLSEEGLRDYVKKRKISGSTRSENGRQCRDAFASLKKTCRKLGIPFRKFLFDRVTGRQEIPALGELIRSRARAPS